MENTHEQLKLVVIRLCVVVDNNFGHPRFFMFTQTSRRQATNRTHFDSTSDSSATAEMMMISVLGFHNQRSARTQETQTAHVGEFEDASVEMDLLGDFDL